MIGVVTISEAMFAASRAGLDLVEISPTVDPPVCKILDFGKFKYDAKKKLQDAKKKQKIVSLKEMKFRPNIGSGDFDIKMRNIMKFLEDGDKVKVAILFKGREIVHQELGHNILRKITESIGENAKIEYEPKMEGKQMIMVIAPNKVVPPKIKKDEE